MLSKELTSYGLLAALKAAATVREASDLVLLKFEKPASMNSEATQTKRAGYYTLADGVKWLYIQVTYQGVKYTGHSSGEYLKK